MSDYREKLQALLHELFQFDSADLDFGFYAVMNQKRDQIAQFIQSDLLDAVAEGLKHIAERIAADAQQAYDQARQALEQQFPGLLQGDEVPQEALKTPYIGNSPIIQTYQETKDALSSAVIAEDLEAQIYNDLYAFFARYYQDGDFISQRRYGHRDRYAIPYNGQEVHLHWANSDQYYVKTGVHFNNYSFTVPGGVSLSEGATIQVRLTKIDVPRDNLKGDKRFFIHAADQTVTWDEETQTLVIPMEYRPPTAEEADRVGSRNQQDKFLQEAHDAILAAIPNPTLRLRLAETDPQKQSDLDRLAYHLNRYAAENTRDFFVHKDLGGFLRREFDYYLKAEVLRLEDIDFDDPIHARRAAARVKTVRDIGERIITFLDQLERFQRQLFLKRKFVLQSDYCLTLDKIPADRRAELYPDILANVRQLAEWQALYGVTITPQTDLNLYPHLMLDTALFDAVFKVHLLACFDDLDDATDGLLMHGENFQALSLLLPRYRGQVKCVYIDPPYNAKSSEILYKNTYKHSSWLALMETRLQVSRDLSTRDGSHIIAIDENEQERFGLLLDALFPDHAKICVAVMHNKKGIQGYHFSYNHDYGYFCIPPELERTNEQDIPKDEWDYANLRKWGSESERSTARNCFYAVLVRDNTIVGFGDVCPEDYHPGSSNIAREDGITEIYPIDSQGVERKWRYARDSVPDILDALKVHTTRTGEMQILKAKTTRQYKTIWDDSKYIAGDYGTRLLTEMGISPPENLYPKSIYTVKDSVHAVSSSGSIVCDYFAGSGTTAHAVMKLNQEDRGQRKYIMVDMADYFDTVLIPRIQKAAFANEWKGGQPVLPEEGQTSFADTGQSHMFQYIRLESYDDTFHNIRFRQVEGPQMSFLSQLPDYTLSYMLDHETAGSPTLLDIQRFSHPFDYMLLATGEDGVLRSQSVDLVTTFSLLIGLAVRTVRHYDHQGQPYVRVMGIAPDGKQTCVLWRNVLSPEQLEAERDWVLANVLHDVDYDRLYVNGENTIPEALLIEEEFKRRMFEDVR
jgi:adenine-specific DNA-methyltransferase